MPEIKPATHAVLNSVREEMIKTLAISAREALDIKAFSDLKKKFEEKIIKLIKQGLPTIKKMNLKY